MNYVCGDNRFEIIERYKKELTSATNIEDSPDEMAVLDNILFRFWQMGWLKEQEKKQITLHKKHVITWGRNDEFNMRKLYEAVCETLLDEGELFIARTDDHEKVDFVFYVAEGR